MALHEIILAALAGGSLLVVLGYGVWTHPSHDRELSEETEDALSRPYVGEC